MTPDTRPRAAPPRPHAARVGAAVSAVLGAWLALVVVGGAAGWFRPVPTPLVPVPVALGLAGLLVAHARSGPLRAWVRRADLRALTLLHAWRVPAGLAFLWFGARGELPALFATLAGWGDVTAGVLALGAPLWHGRRDARRWYVAFHAFGMADFVVAVGTGFAFSLAGDPLMDSVKVLPLALVVLFGVPVTGAFGLVTLDRLRRGG